MKDDSENSCMALVQGIRHLSTTGEKENGYPVPRTGLFCETWYAHQSRVLA